MIKLFVGAICITKLVGFGDTLSQEDNKVLNTAKKRCVFYYPDAPCLIELRKKEEQVYHAICGVNNGKNERTCNE